MGIDKDKSQLTAATELRRHAEKRLRAKTVQLHPPRNEEEMQRLIHELEVHQIELEMQGEEFRQARDDAEAALEKYADLYDFAPVGYFTLDHEGIIRSVNLTGASLLGVERSRLLGRRFGLLVVDAARPFFIEFLGKVFTNPAKEVCEVALLKEGNFPLFVRIEGVAAASGQECRIVLIDITERKRAEEQIKASLAEKEVMLQEIHHRVKNNLQVISSLVSLQADGSTDETVREVLRDVIYRVRSMALVHEKLYQSGSLSLIDFAEYVRGLFGYLWRAHGAAAATVRLTLDLEPVSLSMDIALPCGLILNELAGNALKHAFRSRAEGEVVVTLREDAPGQVSISVRDNGVGLPVGFDWRQASSLGLRLVQMLAAQLNATVEESGLGGTEFRIILTLPQMAKGGEPLHE
jgi:PAS domain S-box-containing protein